MAILDNEGLFSDDQVVTTSAASTNQIDKGAPQTPVRGAAPLESDWGKGRAIAVEAIVTAAFAGGTSIQVDLEVDDDVAFGTPKVVWSSEVIPLASLVQGYRFNVGSFPEGTNERYARLNYTVVGTMSGGGAITAGVAAGLQTNR